jgi:hypothetical protein
MTPNPEIRVIVLDTTGPCAVLAVENWPRERALAFHGVAETKKPRQRARAGSSDSRFKRL